MKNYFKNISPYVIVILVLVIALILTQQCKRSPIVVTQHETTTVVERDTVWDTVRITSKVYIPVPGETIYIDPPLDVNCDELAVEYFAWRVYNDTIIDDTSALVIINDVVTRNVLAQRQWEFVNRRPTIIENTYVTVKPYDCKSFNLGFGGFIGKTFSKPYPISGGSIMLTTNKRSSYAVSVGYMFNETIESNAYKPNLVQFTMYWNIK
jgi:hypothetical protein